MQTGNLLPIESNEHQYILHFTKKCLSFFNLDLELIETIDMPEGITIVNVLPPNKQSKSNGKDVDENLWILRENKQS